MEFIIVLGNSKEDICKSRVRCAVDYFRSREYDLITLIFSGKGSVEKISEAESMRDYALTLGVDSEKCIVENSSMSTVENIDCVVKLLSSRNWFTPTFIMPYTFTICTSQFHAPRSLLIGLTRLSRYGRVQIIHDSDEGTEEIRLREANFLRRQAAIEVERCGPSIS